MRLIDADALADALFDTRKNYPQWVADKIGSMPDAIVRCKECKHRNTIFCFKDEQGFGTDDDWYCADGETDNAD